MRVGDEQSFIEFEFSEVVPGHLPSAGDISCSVEARCGEFRGRVESVWFSREDVSRFLSRLTELEERRQGSASLTNLSSPSSYNPLRFEIDSVDEAGHLAVFAELTRGSYVGGELTPLKVSVSFLLDAGDLPSILVGFRKLFSYK